MSYRHDDHAGVWRQLFAGPFVFGITAFPLTLVGQVRRVAALRRRFLDGRPLPLAGGGAAPSAVLPSLFTLPLTLVAFLLALLTAYLVWAGHLYPLRPDTFPALADPLAPRFGPGTWGGPSLLGAWCVHAMAALGIQVVACTAIRGIGLLCRRITRRYLAT